MKQFSVFLKGECLWATIAVLFVALACGQGVAASPNELSQLTFDLGEGPWSISADRAEFHHDKGVLTLDGNIVATRGKMQFRADRVVYFRKLRLAEAQGNVSLLTEDGWLKADHVWINVTTRLGTIQTGELFVRKGNYFVRGDRIEKTGPARFTIEEGSFTACEGDPPAWAFTGDDIDLTVDGYAQIKSVVFRINGLPVLYVPYFIVPVKVSRQTGFLIPRPEYSSRSGMGLDLPFYWAISDQADATFYEHYLSDRGLKQGVQVRYLTENRSKGTIEFDYLNDMLDDDNYLDDGYSRTNNRRWWIRSKHDQRLPLGMELKADIDLASDQDFVREFSSAQSGFEESNREFEKEFSRSLDVESALYRKSVLNVTRNWDDAGITGKAVYIRSLVKEPEDRVSQQLPSVGFFVPAMRIYDSPAFVKLDTEYTHFWRPDGAEGERLNLTSELSAPYDIGNGIVLTPFAGVGGAMYYVEWDDSTLDDGDEFRHESTVGLEGNVSLARVYDLQFGNVHRVRHEFKPLVRYEYRQVNQASHNPLFDPQDTLDDENVITYGMQNVFTARFDHADGRRSYRDLCRLKITQDYDIDEARRDLAEDEERRPFSDINMELELYPYQGFRVIMDSKVDVYDGEFDVFNTYAWAMDKRGDHIGLDYRYTADSVEELNAFIHAKVNETFFIFGNIKRSLLSDQTIESGIGAEFRFACWGVRAKFEKLEDENRFLVMFNLAGIGRAGPMSSSF